MRWTHWSPILFVFIILCGNFVSSAPIPSNAFTSSENSQKDRLEYCSSPWQSAGFFSIPKTQGECVDLNARDPSSGPQSKGAKLTAGTSKNTAPSSSSGAKVTQPEKQVKPPIAGPSNSKATQKKKADGPVNAQHEALPIAGPSNSKAPEEQKTEGPVTGNGKGNPPSSLHPSQGTRSKVKIYTPNSFQIYTHDDPEQILREARRKAREERQKALQKAHGGVAKLVAYTKSKQAEAVLEREKTRDAYETKKNAQKEAAAEKTAQKAAVAEQKAQGAAGKKKAKEEEAAKKKAQHEQAAKNKVPEEVTPSSSETNTGSSSKTKSGSKKKSAKSAAKFSPDKLIRTNSLRGNNYRQAVIENNIEKGVPYKDSWVADHLLELQAVTHHINMYRADKNHQTQKSGECVEALKAKLNHPDNIEMVDARINGRKGSATTALLKGRRAKYLSPTVQDHIFRTTEKMLSTAGAIDNILESDICGNMPPGMVHHAHHLVGLAQASKSIDILKASERFKKAKAANP